MTQYKLALLMHLLGVTLLAAGMDAAAAGLERARRREHPAEVAVLSASRRSVSRSLASAESFS